MVIRSRGKGVIIRRNPHRRGDVDLCLFLKCLSVKIHGNAKSDGCAVSHAVQVAAPTRCRARARCHRVVYSGMSIMRMAMMMNNGRDMGRCYVKTRVGEENIGYI